MNITKPTLLLDKTKIIQNLTRMVDKAMQNRVHFRPHFKTHQSVEVASWFRAYGIDAITVSSVEMAQYFAENGWQDITIAFPANILQIEAINQLAQEITLNIQVESPEVVQFFAENLTAEVNVWVKIDVGYERTGIPAKNIQACATLVKQIIDAPHLNFKGLLTHAGHTYQARTKAVIQDIYRNSVNQLKNIQDVLPVDSLLSIGDTPTCSRVDVLSDVDEIRPGNFIYYDVMQTMIGSCLEENIAIAAACPVISTHPERNQIVIYGGAVHLSKDFLVNKFGERDYGHVAFLDEKGWTRPIPDAYVYNLSQEHGIIKTDAATVAKVKVGDVLAVLPIHACLTANLLRHNMQVLEPFN